MLDFVQKVPFTHEDIPLPFIYIIPSQLLLYHCQLMAHLSQQYILESLNDVSDKMQVHTAGHHPVNFDAPDLANEGLVLGRVIPSGKSMTLDCQAAQTLVTNCRLINLH